MRRRQQTPARADATHERLIVNPVACDGVGMCAALAPETISLDPWGFPLISAAPLSNAGRAAAARAVTGCPRRALSLKNAIFSEEIQRNPVDN